MLIRILVQFLLADLAFSVSQHPILVVISFDAFKFNFFDLGLTPNLQRLKQEGTHADFLVNVFPTKTFPNHHSIATGLYPETHGVVGNQFFDVKTGKVVGMSPELYNYNNAVVPIWRWNEDQGEGRYSASMMWPGGNFLYQGKNITYVQNYDPNIDWFKRIDVVMEWITNPVKPANLLMIYFEEPDTHLHALGPDSPIVRDLIRKLDNVTQYFELQLKRRNIKDKVNIINLSDHGIVGVTPPHFVNVTQYLKNGTYVWSEASPAIQITPNTGHEAEIYNALKAGSMKGGHFAVYKKSEYLERWHYKNNPRSPPILIMADVGYALDDLIINAPKYAEAYNFTLTNSSQFGVHGYDYNVTSMHPFFMARGPKIKKNHKVANFHTVDLMNLFTSILEIPPSPNNGSSYATQDVLATKSTLLMIVGGVLIALLVVSLAAIVVLVIIKRQQNITTTAALNKRFPQNFHNNVIEAQHLLEPEDA